MYISMWIAGALSMVAVAHPTIRLRDGDSWSPGLTDYFQAIGESISKDFVAPSRTQTTASPAVCDLSQVVMPTVSPALPSPSSGATLYHVAVGRGVQNYTCANNSAQATPVALGAVATLYNVSCIAAAMPVVLPFIPAVALQYTNSSGASELAYVNADMTGHHYFTDASTPTFNMDTSAAEYGIMLGSKNASSPAPSGAPAGLEGESYGAVPWLKITSKSSTGQFTEAYRLSTAGGNPPPSCEGQKIAPDVISVDYAALYYLWSP